MMRVVGRGEAVKSTAAERGIEDRDSPPPGQEEKPTRLMERIMKKRISSTDLSWQFFERMRDNAVFQKGVSVAVVPDDKLGWRAVLRGRKMSAPAQRRFKAIEKQLRETFALSKD